MFDFSDEAFVAQLTPEGTYMGRLAQTKFVGADHSFLVFTWELQVPDRADRSVLEDFFQINVGPNEDPSDAVSGRARLKAIFDAHGLPPRFESESELRAAIVGKEMQVVVRHRQKDGMPVAKVAKLLPPDRDEG